MSLEAVFSQHLRPEFRPRAQHWGRSSDKMLSPLPALQVTHGHRTRGKVLGLSVVNTAGREGLQWRPPEDDPAGHPGPMLQAEGAAHAAVSGRPGQLEASGQGDGVQSSGAGVGWGLPCVPVSLWALSQALDRPGSAGSGQGAEMVNPLHLS